MLRYSINIGRDDIALAYGKDIDASFKDLTQVCGEIRYMKADDAVALLERVADMRTAIPFKRFNKRLGSRHELGGKKGAYPVKAAREARKVLLNAMANAANKGLDTDALYVVHASANKTHIERRNPSKGSLSWGRGRYGFPARVHSDLEYAKVEIGVASKELEQLTESMRKGIRFKERIAPKEPAKKPAARADAQKKKQEKQGKQGKQEKRQEAQEKRQEAKQEAKAQEVQAQTK
jgi:large subunit ribosomal protein L22